MANSTFSATVQCPTGEKTKAKDIAQYGVASIDKNASIYQAIALMIKKNVSGLPVVDESGLVGVITEKDALRLLCDSAFVEGCVGDYMTTRVVTFDEEDDIADICRCLINNSFRRVFVTHEGKLAGIVTRADLIKANKNKFRPQAAGDSLTTDAGPAAKDVMKSGLLYVTKATPVYEAMEIMATKNVTGLPVVDEYINLVGVISEKDMLKMLYDPTAKPGLVEDYMTSGTVSFDKNTSLFEICRCLVDNNFRRVFIVDGGKLLGIISRTDVMAYIMQNRSRFFSQKQKVTASK